MSVRLLFAFDAYLSVPIANRENWSDEEIKKEVENNCQSILGYVVRWINQGIGCSKVPDINDVGLMEDRATCRISSQILANWLKHEVISKDEFIRIMKKMAIKVDNQNANDNNYKPMSNNYDTFAFDAASRLVLDLEIQVTKS